MYLGRFTPHQSYRPGLATGWWWGVVGKYVVGCGSVGLGLQVAFCHSGSQGVKGGRRIIHTAAVPLTVLGGLGAILLPGLFAGLAPWRSLKLFPLENSARARESWRGMGSSLFHVTTQLPTYKGCVCFRGRYRLWAPGVLGPGTVETAGARRLLLMFCTCDPCPG